MTAPAEAPGRTFPRLERVEVPDGIRGRHGISVRMRHAARAVAEALFATEAGPPPEDRIEWLLDELDHFLRHAGPRARILLRLCLLAIGFVSPLLIGRWPPFRALSVADRTRALERMEGGVLGFPVFGAKLTLSVLYYEHPDPAREIGFDGLCLLEARERANGNRSLPVVTGEEP